MGLDVVLGTVLTEFVIIELAAIVHNERVWYTEPRGDVFMDKRVYVPLSDGRVGFGFGPFGEVVDGNNYVVAFSLSWRAERS